MRHTWAALFLVAALLPQIGGAEAQNSKVSVLMQMHGPVPQPPQSPPFLSTTRCSLLTFVAGVPPSQPDDKVTVCAIGGPFGAGMVGIVESGNPHIGNTITADEALTFSPMDVLYIHIVLTSTDTVMAGPPGSNPHITGGLQYLSGSWVITGGTGVFAGLKGNGERVQATVSNQGTPPYAYPQYFDAQLVGFVQ